MVNAAQAAVNRLRSLDHVPAACMCHALHAQADSQYGNVKLCCKQIAAYTCTRLHLMSTVPNYKLASNMPFLGITVVILLDELVLDSLD